MREKGALSGLIIDEVEDMPSSSAFRSRFGSLLRAYQLVGYTPARDYRYVETNRTLRELHPEVVASVVADVEACGASVTRDFETDLLRINDELTVSIVIVRCQETAAGALRWKVRLDTGLRPDLSIAVRMAPDNRSVRDYYLLPWLEVGGDATVRLAPENEVKIDSYQCDDLSRFLDLTRRAPLRLAA